MTGYIAVLPNECIEFMDAARKCEGFRGPKSPDNEISIVNDMGKKYDHIIISNPRRCNRCFEWLWGGQDWGGISVAGRMPKVPRQN